MRYGIFGDGDIANVETVTAAARAARDDGFAHLWIPQIFGIDALTALAVAGREVPDIELGTAVVPTFPRHPAVLATQALTVTQTIGPRLNLGVGLSHQTVVEAMWGLSFAKPVRHLREYLAVLAPLLRSEAADASGEGVSGHLRLGIADAPPPRLLVAALGAQMLAATAELADGTITWMASTRVIAEHTAPTITRAADAAGRPAPTVAVGLPICVTADAAAARERAARLYAVYGNLPSYRAMLDRGGAEGPADVAIVGTEEEVTAAMHELADAGATDLIAAVFGSREERPRTRALLAELAAAGGG
jgi:5,10-methylenetetrahydromethanopterin reductase